MRQSSNDSSQDSWPTTDHNGLPATHNGKLLPLARACIEKYGNRQKFMETFNPDCQQLTTMSERKTYCGTAPALSVVRAAYGNGTAKSWLVIQIEDLSKFAGVRDKMNTRQLEQIAEVILSNWYYLKVTEFMLFINQFKAGRYGRFYGVVDAMAITEALQKFCAERRNIIARLDAEAKEMADSLEREQRAASGDCISREEWDELKWLWNMGYEPEQLCRERNNIQTQ